jgi:hypothetical protein
MDLKPQGTVRGSRIEHGFYSIVRWFGLISTAVALIIALVAAVSGVSKLTLRPDTRIHRPTTSYADYQRIPQIARAGSEPTTNDTTLAQKLNDVDAARAAANAEFEKYLKPHLDAIVSNLASYAAKTDQAKPAGQAVGDYVRSSAQQMGHFGQADLAWEYVDGLDKATGDLAADADSLAKLEISDPRRVRWDTFLDWYTKQYTQQLGAELERIDVEKAKGISNLAEAPMFLYAAGIAFGIFVLGTIILVLLRIELNTRPESS